MVICPFHDENSASFVIYLDTESFYCFGCHIGGDVIALYAFAHGITNKEAIYRLAEELGLLGNSSIEDKINAKKAANEREIRAGLNDVAGSLIKQERCKLCAIYRIACEAEKEWQPKTVEDLDNNSALVWAQRASLKYERLLDYLDSLSPEEQRGFAIHLRKERLGDE